MILNISRRNVITVRESDSVKEAAGRMDYYNVGAVVVVRRERAVGILTDRDLALRALSPKSNGKSPDTILVGDVMTPKVHTIREEDGFEKALGLMQSLGVRRLPVVDRRGNLTGLITMDDLMEVLGRNVNTAASAIRRQNRGRKVAKARA